MKSTPNANARVIITTLRGSGVMLPDGATNPTGDAQLVPTGEQRADIASVVQTVSPIYGADFDRCALEPRDIEWALVSDVALQGHLQPEAWARLTKQTCRRGQMSSGLIELAVSLALDRRLWLRRVDADALDKPAVLQASDQLFERVWNEVHRPVGRYIASRFGTKAGNPFEVAHDVLSDMFVDYWSESAKRTFHARSSIFSFACGIAKNHALDRMRPAERELERVVHPDASQFANLAVRSPFRGSVPMEVALSVQLGRAKLTPRQQLMIRLLLDVGWTATEIASKLGVDVSCVSNSKKRARKTLQNWVLAR